MRFLPLNCVKEGHVLAQTLYNEYDNVLLSTGVELNDSKIEYIRKNGYNSIYVFDEYSKKEIHDVVAPQIRQMAKSAVKKTMESMVESLEHQDEEFSFQGNIQEITEIAERLIAEIVENENLMINLVDIKTADNYTYSHSVNVGIVSIIFGIILKYRYEDLKKLAIGAMLHDIGKIFISNDILNKKGPLSKDEFELMKRHTKLGYDYLKKYTDIDEEICLIVLEHHENIDGSGYPDSKREHNIRDFSKIVAIADVYDALTSDRPYRLAKTPMEAIEFIMANAYVKFDYVLVKLFMKNIIPYPVGSVVRLSDGSSGVVIKINKNYPLRPIIELIDGIKLSGIIINLLEKKNIIINSPLYEV